MLIHPIYNQTNIGIKMNEFGNADSKHIDLKSLEDYYQSKTDILHFDTEEGIFEIINNRIYKLVKNSESEHVPFNQIFSLTLQPSNIGRKEIFYIPIHYIYKKLELKKYKLTPKSLLTLVLKNNTEIYFETNETEITESIKEDMITFLSLLKLYK